MKKHTVYFISLTIGITFVICLALSSTVLAQSYEQETELLQSLWGKEKRELVEQYMGLFEIDGRDFWPIYEEYAAKRQEIGRRRIDIIMDYANNYETMTNEKASSISKAVFKNNLQLEKLQQQYYKKMSKVIEPLKATQFMQFEKYLETVIRTEIQANIPFLKELETKRDS